MPGAPALAFCPQQPIRPSLFELQARVEKTFPFTRFETPEPFFYLIGDWK
jgi:hypothetical protein